jgi:hypothetical protein
MLLDEFLEAFETSKASSIIRAKMVTSLKHKFKVIYSNQKFTKS